MHTLGRWDKRPLLEGRDGLFQEVDGRSCVPFPLLTGGSSIITAVWSHWTSGLAGDPCNSNHAEALVGNEGPRLSQDATLPWITGLRVCPVTRVIVVTHWDKMSRWYTAVFLLTPLTHLSALWLVEKIRTEFLEQHDSASLPNRPLQGLIFKPWTYFVCTFGCNCNSDSCGCHLGHCDEGTPSPSSPPGRSGTSIWWVNLVYLLPFSC